ncbi:MAG: hypothetical protein HY337_11290 [Gemmatimonadetes bacterium]|nr:hypothetical protein [Gemmatimonadota bacterium]
MPEFLFWNEVVIPLAGMAVGVILGLPLIKAIVRRIEGRPTAPGSEEVQALRAEVAELRRRLESAEDVANRVAELEERADFAERLLTQQRDRSRLPPG